MYKKISLGRPGPKRPVLRDVMGQKQEKPSTFLGLQARGGGWSWELMTRFGSQGRQEGDACPGDPCPAGMSIVRGLACGLLALETMVWSKRACPLSLPRLHVYPPLAGTPCLAPWLQHVPSVLRFCSCDIDQKLSQLGLLSLPQLGKGTNSAGRRRPSAAGPCKPSRSVHSWELPHHMGREAVVRLCPQTPVPGILAVTAPLGPIEAWSQCGQGRRLEDSGHCCTPTAPRRAPLRYVSFRWEKVDKMLPCPRGAVV